MSASNRPRPAASWPRIRPLDSFSISKEDMASSCFLRLCTVLALVSSTGGMLSFAIHVILFFGLSRGVVDTVLHVYTCIFSAMIVVTEREWGWFFDMFGFLKSWVGRGVFITFNGLLLLAYSEESHRIIGMICRYGVAFYLITIGAVYLFLGVLCMEKIKTAQLTRIRRKKAISEHIEKLKEREQKVQKEIELFKKMGAV